MEREIPNFLSEAVIRDIEEFEAELGRRGAEPSSAINPAQAIGSGDIVNSRFPERVGRIKPDALEIATAVNEAGQPVIDPVVFNSVSRMDAGE